MDSADHQSSMELTIQWKREERRKLRGRVIRRSIAIPFLLLWLVLICFGILWLPAFALMILGAIFIAPDIAEYFSSFAGSILWSHREAEPKPLYSIAESRVAEGKYAEAETEYEKIIQQFPNEVKPHVDMINIAVTRLDDGDLAQKLYQRGKSLLQNPADRDILTEMYTATRTRLKSQDEADGKVIPLEDMKGIRTRLARDRHKLWR